MFCGTESFFRTGYRAHLVSAWLPALDGVVERLKRGARVADIGCGHGASTIVMAQAFPKSSFIGLDYHDASIATARQRAAEQGVTGNIAFEVKAATEFDGHDFDLICFMDCLHDLGDPVGALARCRKALKSDGKVLLVEPYAGDRLEQNLNPIGRMYYAASAMACTPNSLSQEVGLGLGAQAGEERLRKVAREAGFSNLRRAAQTPVNLILELTRTRPYFQAVVAMEDTTREVVAGSSLANQAGHSLQEIGGVSSRLAELIQSISLASKQQARGSSTQRA